MISKVPFYLSIALLILAGIALSVFRHQNYGVAWTPGATSKIWDVEARIEFSGQNKPVTVSLAAPKTQAGFTLINESSSSPGYGVSYVSTDSGRRAEWSVRNATGPQTIYYKAQFLIDPQANVSPAPPKGEIQAPAFSGPVESAAMALIKQATERSANDMTFTRELIKSLNDTDSQNASLILNDLTKVEAVDKLLAYAKVPSKIVGVIELEDGRRRQNIEHINQVWDGSKWVLFNPNDANPVISENILVWDETNVSLLDLVGGKNSQVHFSMIAQEVSSIQATKEKAMADGLLNFSIHSLPLEEQAMFKTIMLIPIGALIVVFLRVIIGLKTSGTFMRFLLLSPLSKHSY